MPEISFSKSFGPAGQLQYIKITGTGLGPGNVSSEPNNPGVRLSTVGLEDVNSDGLDESAPAAGTHPELVSDLFSSVQIVQHTDTLILASTTLDERFADSQIRVHLFRPSSHPDGAGEWPQSSIDGITPLDPNRGGMTLTGPRTAQRIALNTKRANGPTRLSVARDFQNQLVGSEGSTISVTFRIHEASIGVPTVVAVPDPVYGTVATNVTVSPTASPLEYVLSLRVPTAGETPGYPFPSFTATNPSSLGVRFSNGTPLVSGIIGAAAWYTPGLDQVGFVRLDPAEQIEPEPFDP
jgi:hypothetical protein